MSVAITITLIIFAAISFSILVDRDAVEMLPVTCFSIILFLYFFYCTDILAYGIVILYFLLLTLIIYAAFYAIKRKISPIKKITPALLIFVCTVIFFYFYTKDNQSVLWDELRVWSAMPKAIYETQQLQLGPEAYIFSSMQSYPPALPLFTYFIMSAMPSFLEGLIFFAYAVFVASITINIFKNISWKQYGFYPLIFFTIIVIPCIFTKHGGDYCWFYKSLFIDPVLGFAAGYVLCLAGNNPLKSKISLVQFTLALAVLTIIKDSGIMFSLIALVCAACIQWTEHKNLRKTELLTLFVPAVSVLAVFLLWKGLLSHYNTSNHLGLQFRFPSIKQCAYLVYGLLINPMITVKGIEFSFFGYYVIILVGYTVIERKYGSYSVYNYLCSNAALVISVVLFSFGYLLVFVNHIISYSGMLTLSFGRYFTTLLCAFFVFYSLRSIPAVQEKLVLHGFKKNIIILSISILFLSNSGWSFLRNWEKYNSNYNIEIREAAKEEKTKIAQSIFPDDEVKEVYLLIAEEEPAYFHHRFYFELIGSGIQIKNFGDTDMHIQTDDYPQSLEETAENWYSGLVKEGYDYIYLYSVNEDFEKAFAHLGLGEAIPGKAYKVQPAH